VSVVNPKGAFFSPSNQLRRKLRKKQKYNKNK